MLGHHFYFSFMDIVLIHDLFQIAKIELVLLFIQMVTTHPVKDSFH